MNNGFLSQEEINSLLAGNGEDAIEKSNEIIEEEISDVDKDILGELGNISMGSASTALSTIIGQAVNITTPTVAVTTLRKLKETFDVPNIALDVEYVTGIVGGNVFVMKISDAAVIANLMMGGNGEVDPNIEELSEIEVSAVSEAMNQMIGSAATSMATMFAREVNISPPTSIQWNDETDRLAKCIGNDDVIVRVAFNMTIGDLVDSTIMQILPIATAKTIINIMMGNETEEQFQQDMSSPTTVDNRNDFIRETSIPNNVYEEPEVSQVSYTTQHVEEKPIERQPVNVKQATFSPLTGTAATEMPHNIDLILDVQLDIAVVLGRTKMNIKDILDLGAGSLIELDKLAEEPVEILVNGKKVAMGEVVVVDENFGVRINSIVSSEDRVRSLGK